MTIDEAIEKYREKGNPYGSCCEGCEKEHEQLAEWLEELKAYRTLDKTNFSDGYNKAIDDFVKELCKAFDETTLNDDGYYPNNVVRSIAEQLKAGGNNEMEK